MLYRRAIEAGATISFGSDVVLVDSSTPCITLANGKKIFGDIIIGADGGKSIVRKIFFEDKGEKEKDDIFTTYLFVSEYCFPSS